MRDKKDDQFFEEEKDGSGQEKELIAMLDKYETPGRAPARQLKPGARVRGTVSRIGTTHAFVDIDGKNEGAIGLEEFRTKAGELTVKQGDAVELFISAVDADGVSLTRSLSGLSAGTAELMEAMQNRVPVQGKVTGINKGGLQVRVMGQRGFCPVSQIELAFVEDVNTYLGKTLDFVITRVTENGRNIVLSRIPLLEGDLGKKLDGWAADVEAKTVFTGTVTRIAEFGLFVDMGGVEGLVHISEVSYERSENLAETFSPGQKVEYVILKIEKREQLRQSRISLSLKQAQEDPWKTVSARFTVGERAEGTITRIMPFGAFVELTPGIEGLIHVSEMSWVKRVNHPQDVVAPGDRVTVSILGIDEQKRNISCSLKDVADDPWQGAGEKYVSGSTVVGTVASKSKYGYFIDIAEGVTGLLPLGSIAADKKDDIKPGRQLEVMVEKVDPAARRMSLSLGVRESQAEDRAAQEYMRSQPAQQKPAVTGSSEFGQALLDALNRKKGS